jgi:hypothetical protein
VLAASPYSFGDEMKIWAIGIILVAVSIGQAGESIDLSLTRLAKVDVFAFGGTGYAGVISQGEKDFRVVLSNPSASNNFEKLYASGSPQARCYALVGIRLLNPERFKRLSSELRTDKTKVLTQEGCTIFHETMSSVVKRIEAGDYK